MPEEFRLNFATLADRGSFEWLADCADQQIAEEVCLRRAKEMCAEYYPKRPRGGEALAAWKEVNEE